MEDIKDEIKKAVLNFDRKKVTQLTQGAIRQNVDPVEIFGVFREVIGKVGDDFSRGLLFLPHLIGAADAVEGGMPIIIEEIKIRGKKVESLGKVVIGTVFGDIHSIGKTMVATLLSAEGFTVYDLGVNIPASEFVRAVETYRAEILAMSALLTTTAPEQRKVIHLLEEKNLRGYTKVMVGGGAISQEFAEEIGADGYSGSAPGAVKLALHLRKIQR
ncbi:MAG: cobalamin B12-binding domain-containing protein [Thermodesulfovibrionales bacterium]